MEYTPMDKLFTQHDYDLAHSVCSELVDEIQENRNVFININKKQIIKTFKEQRR